jgi:hypothetical protein
MAFFILPLLSARDLYNMKKAMYKALGAISRSRADDKGKMKKAMY